jgi:hypothetical protein
MRINKFLSVISLVTVFSLLYVYQQSEVFLLAYAGQRRQAAFQDLADKNNVLRYNIEKKTSLVCLGDKISGSADFQMPDSYRTVRVYSPTVGSQPKVESPNRETILSRIFGIKTQAEAKTINP